MKPQAIWTKDDILKKSALIVKCKLQGERTRDSSPDLTFQKQHQTSILTEVRREYPDLADEQAMKIYYSARDARLAGNIAEMIHYCQELAEQYWGYWPNTLWYAYALRIFSSDYHEHAEIVFNEAEKAIYTQLSGELPLNIVPTTQKVTQHHLREIQSMLLNNHAEFHRVRGLLEDALVKIDESIAVTEHDDMMVRRLLAKAGILAQLNKIAEAKDLVAKAKKVDDNEYEHQISHVTRHYPGMANVVQEVS